MTTQPATTTQPVAKGAVQAPELELLAALTALVANWGSVATQEEIALRAGVAVEPGDVQPLYALGRTGPQRSSTLADTLRLSRPTMSKQLRRLAAAGLIDRSADAADGRASIVSLSTAGAEAYRRLVREGVVMVRGALSEWDAAGADAFARNLSRFVAALTAGETSASLSKTRAGESTAQKEER
ncbi:MarR family winged helix-turn-helix transcriptional regulator [Humibacter albus]|uniref:MarR family winged helix-turn-helix transcriptional regulator n=1 Tax=Humibacter albus TaxID=427754 RepID=UPI0003B381B8|nr:MarR family transcriptional regulator [Humibacter albus]